MRREFLRILIVSSVMALCYVSPIQASEKLGERERVEKINRESTLQAKGENTAISRIFGTARGSIISTATLLLTDKGEGQIDVIIETLAQKNSDEIRHTAILEMKDKDGSWFELGRYEFDAVRDDYPDKYLAGLTNEFRVKNLKINEYYRVRGIHFVWLDGKSQAFVTQTDELMLQKYPG